MSHLWGIMGPERRARRGSATPTVEPLTQRKPAVRNVPVRSRTSLAPIHLGEVGEVGEHHAGANSEPKSLVETLGIHVATEDLESHAEVLLGGFVLYEPDKVCSDSLSLERGLDEQPLDHQRPPSGHNVQ